MKARFLSRIFVFALFLSSCSIEVNRPADVTASTTSVPQSNTTPSTQIPMTWAHLNLSGSLVYINGSMVDNISTLQIQVLDLITSEVTTIFDAPQHSWIYYITVTPDNKQLVMSYSPPPGDVPAGQNLYIMPVDGSQPPQLLFMPPTKEHDYIEVEYSPDGQYIYFTRANGQTAFEPGQVYPLYEIYRMAVPDGRPEKIAAKAYWLRPSPDSSHIAYVSVDPFSLWNKLYIADADGGNAHEVILTSPLPPDIIDAPMFSPDGQFILFSAPVPTQSYQPNWIDRLMGVGVVKAHSNVTSDWWSVSVSGGAITQLTNIQSSDLFASIAPDNKHIASYSTDGIFVMEPNGSEVTMLIPNPQAVPGTVRWIP